MPYQHSLDIELRLVATLRLIRTGKYSTATLAESLGISVPTASRCIQALRDRGHDIQAERAGRGWRYVIKGKSQHGILSRDLSAEPAQHSVPLQPDSQP